VFAEGVVDVQDEDVGLVVVEIAVAAAHAVELAVDAAVVDRRIQADDVVAQATKLSRAVM
jgi:hypothetical protein